jgi:Leucine-rich repeat (LRR) protein
MKYMQVLYLGENYIEDISPLEAMPHIGELSRIPAWGEVEAHLSLAYNRISDISPLVNNAGIGEGDVVDLRGNPLDAIAYGTHIPALEERGVKVLVDYV